MEAGEVSTGEVYGGLREGDGGVVRLWGGGVGGKGA